MRSIITEHFGKDHLIRSLPCFISPPLVTSLSCPPFSTEQFSLCPPHLEQFYNISFTFQSRMVFGRATFLLLSLVFPAAFSYRVSTEEVVFKWSRSNCQLTILQKWSPSYFNHRYFSGPSASDYPTYIAPKVSFLNKTCSLSMFWKPKLLHHTERINFIHLNI